MPEPLARRTTIAGVAGLGLGVPLLAACGGGGTSSGGSGTSSGTSSGAASARPSGSGATPAVVGKTSDIAVGGGKVYSDLNLVVTQPEAGTFKAFDATCTHQGCQVSKVEDGTIDCTCHFSRFSIEDGSVEDGPAPKPLPEVPIMVSNGQITLA